MSVLPRLLYVADVSVDSTSCGGALIYRLLEDYPSDRLLIIEKAHGPSLVKYRLRNVSYKPFSMGTAVRWQNTRFAEWANSWLALSASRATRRLWQLLGGFNPECVMTATHGHLWITAAQFAQDTGLPLHLVLHDDWLTIPMASCLKHWHARQFASVYRQAVSRLCISPFMEEAYRERCGVDGQVVYPSRAKDSPVFERPASSSRKQGRPLIGAFAGNMFHPSYARLIATLAKCLEKRGGRLLLFGSFSIEQLQNAGLNLANVVAQRFVPSRELILRLREEADFLFVPMSFEQGAIELNMRLGFPSKLADCTATGLPLLICGPSYCSAVRWAQAYAPVAEVVTSPSIEDMSAAVQRLECARHRERLGKSAMEVGGRLFSHSAALKIFYRALQGETSDAFCSDVFASQN